MEGVSCWNQSYRLPVTLGDQNRMLMPHLYAPALGPLVGGLSKERTVVLLSRHHFQSKQSEDNVRRPR